MIVDVARRTSITTAISQARTSEPVNATSITSHAGRYGLPPEILLAHLLERQRLIIAGVAGLPELAHPFGHDVPHALAHRLGERARIEILRRAR